MKPSIFIAGLLAATVSLQACTVRADSKLPDSGYSPEEEEIFRIESCVRGGLPKEIQFVTDGSPPSLARHESIDARAVDAVARAVDAQIAALLSDAASRAWASAGKGSETPDFETLFLSFDQILVETAPQRLTLTFCGDQEQVGRSIAMALTSWFNRALPAEAGAIGSQGWLAGLGPRGTTFGAAFLQLAVALRLADINYSLDDLRRGFAEFAAPKS